MALQSFLDPSAWEVRNHAQSGRSARSFIEQGWLAGIGSELQAGDMLLIQFGHNDQKLEDPSRYNEPHKAFPMWLQRYVALARQKGARPILLTPLARRKFDGNQLLDTHGLYTDAVGKLAKQLHVELIDLNTLSMDWLRKLGPENSKRFFMHVPEARTPTTMQADDTHLRARGALQVACMIVSAWQLLEPQIKTQVIRDTRDCNQLPDPLLP
jgi:lysophospholipase L1-like esterase